MPGELLLTSPPAGIVLDTNVVLDWLLFNDPSLALLGAAVAAGQVLWLATSSMRDELQHVLERGLAASRSANATAILARWDAHAHLQPEAPGYDLRCSDPDDQKFIDLAVVSGARWLVSRDRAVLKLARRAAPLGLAIVPPRHWVPQS